MIITAAIAAICLFVGFRIGKCIADLDRDGNEIEREMMRRKL